MTLLRLRRIRLRFVWRDLWIGAYIDTNGRIYVTLFPTIVIVYYRRSYWRITDSGVPAYHHPTKIFG